MKLFGLNITRKAVGSPVRSSGGWFSIIRDWYSGAWQNNDEINVDTVLAHHAVYSCITLIANDIGKLRPRIVEQDSDGIWSETYSEMWNPLLRKPNRHQNHIQFKQWWITSKLLHGNTYALKGRDSKGNIIALYLLDPLRTQVMVAPDGSVFYHLQPDNLSGIPETGLSVPSSEIIHDRMNCLFHPLIGVSPLYAAGNSAALSLNILKNSDKFFKNASRPSGILTAPGSISPQSAESLKTYWQENFTGDNAGKVAVVGDGLKFESMRMNAVDSQLIEQLKWNSEVVCSTFHVPPYKIGVGAMPAYNNIEALNQEYYGQSLQVLIEEMEESLDFGFGLESRRNGKMLGVELDLDGLLRMDTATLIDTMGKGVTNAIMTTDEARRRLDLKKVKGGDVIWRQQQYYSLSALHERDQHDPFKDSPGKSEAVSEEELADQAAEFLTPMLKKLKERHRCVA
jgi:HK97 family phage portal protein